MACRMLWRSLLSKEAAREKQSEGIRCGRRAGLQRNAWPRVVEQASDSTMIREDHIRRRRKADLSSHLLHLQAPPNAWCEAPNTETRQQPENPPVKPNSQTHREFSKPLHSRSTVKDPWSSNAYSSRGIVSQDVYVPFNDSNETQSGPANFAAQRCRPGKGALGRSMRKGERSTLKSHQLDWSMDCLQLVNCK